MRVAQERAAEERRVAEELAADEKRLAEHRLTQQRAATVELIRHQLAEGELAAAQKELEENRSSLGDWPELAAVGKDLDRAQVRQRQQLTSALLAEAKQLGAGQQFEAAEAKLGEATALSPTDERVLQALLEVRAAAASTGRRKSAPGRWPTRWRRPARPWMPASSPRPPSVLTPRSASSETAPSWARCASASARRAGRSRSARPRSGRPPGRPGRQESKVYEDGQTMRLVREDAVSAAAAPGIEEEDTRPLTMASLEEACQAGDPGSWGGGDAASRVARADLASEARGSAPQADEGARACRGSVRQGGVRPDAQTQGGPCCQARAWAGSCATWSRRGSRPGDTAPGAFRAIDRRSPARARRRWPLLAAAGVVLAVVVGIGILKSRPLPGPHPTPAPPLGPSPAVATPLPVAAAQGSLIIAAIPWAEVVSVTGANGQAVELPANRTTPLLLQLAPGRYVVSLRDPTSGAKRSQGVDVAADRPTRLVAEVGRCAPRTC